MSTLTLWLEWSVTSMVTPPTSRSTLWEDRGLKIVKFNKSFRVSMGWAMVMWQGVNVKAKDGNGDLYHRDMEMPVCSRCLGGIMDLCQELVKPSLVTVWRLSVSHHISSCWSQDPSMQEFSLSNSKKISCKGTKVSEFFRPLRISANATSTIQNFRSVILKTSLHPSF